MKESCLEFNKLQRPNKTAFCLLDNTSQICIVSTREIWNLLLRYYICILWKDTLFGASINQVDKLTGLNIKAAPWNKWQVFKSK